MSSADQGELAGSISHPDTPYDGARHGYNLSNTTDTDGDDVAGMEDDWPRDSEAATSGSPTGRVSTPSRPAHEPLCIGTLHAVLRAVEERTGGESRRAVDSAAVTSRLTPGHWRLSPSCSNTPTMRWRMAQAALVKVSDRLRHVHGPGTLGTSQRRALASASKHEEKGRVGVVGVDRPHEQDHTKMLELVLSDNPGQVQALATSGRASLLRGDSFQVMADWPASVPVDLIVTSPPYNMSKSYETKQTMDEYVEPYEGLARQLFDVLSPQGSVCWQVGSHVKNNVCTPLDFLFHPLFIQAGFTLRNRIVWKFGHGHHAGRRFSGRYEAILWYTKSEEYTFNLDDVRVPSKYPGKRHFRGSNKGQYSGNPLGKNPEDVWDIPNVKANHVEKTIHPCQFPVGLIEPLVLALTNPGDLILDPFCGVATSGVAALLHGRRYVGVDAIRAYLETGLGRLEDAANGVARYRSWTKPIYDHMSSPLSMRNDTTSVE